MSRGGWCWPWVWHQRAESVPLSLLAASLCQAWEHRSSLSLAFPPSNSQRGGLSRFIPGLQPQSAQCLAYKAAHLGLSLIPSLVFRWAAPSVSLCGPFCCRREIGETWAGGQEGARAHLSAGSKSSSSLALGQGAFPCQWRGTVNKCLVFLARGNYSARSQPRSRGCWVLFPCAPSLSYLGWSIYFSPCVWLPS